MNQPPRDRDEVADAVDADVDELSDDDPEVVAGMNRLRAIRDADVEVIILDDHRR